jgi:hypothetical protein
MELDEESLENDVESKKKSGLKHQLTMEEDNEDDDEEARMQRRQLIRQRALERKQEVRY